MNRVGKIFCSLVQFYNSRESRVDIKKRPVLILKEPETRQDRQHVVLPISTLLKEWHRNETYDVMIDPAQFSLLRLKRISYIRCHKQFTVYDSEIDFVRCIGDLKLDYPSTWKEVLRKLIAFEMTIV